MRVLFPEYPWDRGTREEGTKDWVAQAGLMKEIDADGLMGDTMDGMPHSYLEASDAVHHPLALHPEGLPAEEALGWNQLTWGYWSYPFVPMISRYKWLERRHMPILISNGRHHVDGMQAAFFNGVGYSDQQDVVGVHNGWTEREHETLRRMATIERAMAPLMVSPDWEPFAETEHEGVFASRFPLGDEALWTVVNRNEFRVSGEQIQVAGGEGRRYFDLWRGVEVKPETAPDGRARLSFEMEALGFGAVLERPAGPVPAEPVPAELERLLETMRRLSARPLASYDDTWKVLPQEMAAIAPTVQKEPPPGMVLIPGGRFEFRVSTVGTVGRSEPGVDVQYPWEDAPRRSHEHSMELKPFYMDRYPVTNGEFKRFLEAAKYHPRDDHNFLRDWKDGSYPEGWAERPVTWVSLEDAREYARWAGKRLPNEWEWQYAAQGTDGRLYPWGNEWDEAAAPVADKVTRLTAPDEVRAHPRGASPFGVMDMVGNVWQWTNEFQDEHTRSATLRGGSYYQPQGSMWYFPQAYQLNQHSKYLLMAPSEDRAGTIGFRCAADVR